MYEPQGGGGGVTCMSTPCNCACWVRTAVTASRKELQTWVHAGDGIGTWARPLTLTLEEGGDEDEEVEGGGLDPIPNPDPGPNPDPNPNPSPSPAPSPCPVAAAALTVSYLMVPAFGW